MQIGDKTLAEWKEFARRDDCLERMVPSDLRQILMAIEFEREACASLADFFGHKEKNSDISRAGLCWHIRDAIRDRARQEIGTQDGPPISDRD